MFQLILYQPEIPPNTGNIIRLCANTGTRLHLVHPLGFDVSDRSLRRAGLDYHQRADMREHPDLETCLGSLGEESRVYALSTRGGRSYTEPEYRNGDAFLLGPETRGLPGDVLESVPHEYRLRIPMRPGNRSLNLANAAAVIVYEAWRQLGFSGAG